MQDSDTLIQVLFDRSVSISISVAKLCQLCERLYQPKQGVNVEVDEDSVERLFEQAERFDNWFPDELFERNSLDSEKERLLRLVLQAWARETSPATSRRPDVLVLTCQFLANPAAPHTYDIVRYVVVMSLRTLYGVRYTNESLRELRNSYDNLRARFTSQQRRRQKRDSSTFENLLVDVLCLDQRIHRSLRPQENLAAYYSAFEKYLLGVDHARRRRHFAENPSTDWPELKGTIPDFGYVLNLLFAQPTAVRGLDQIIGGLISPVRSRDGNAGGLVTLIDGPPGSGKTSLCLSLASRMAQLGSYVRYVATEETTESIEGKRTAISDSTTASLWPELASLSERTNRNFRIIDEHWLKNLQDVADTLHRELYPLPSGTSSDDHTMYLTFPRTLVLDSITGLLEAENSNGGSSRQQLARVLKRIRDAGACVFLVGSEQDCNEHGLGYLVDNIFTLGMLNLKDERQLRTPPMRTLIIEKTRLQTSSRGQHTLHLSRSKGFAVSPSLYSVLTRLKQHALMLSNPERRAVVWAGKDNEARKYSPVTIRDRSQCLVYGRGSTGKARFGIALALEPRVDSNPQRAFHSYVLNHGRTNTASKKSNRAHLNRVKLLVLSFLYPPEYYHDYITTFLKERFGVTGGRARQFIDTQVRVVSLYPGPIDSETVVGFITEYIEGGILEGKPFTVALIDGVHNLLVQFPLLEREPLLWPTLYRLFRTEGIDAVTTFTFFQMAKFKTDESNFFEAGGITDSGDLQLARSERLFFHLLVSNCDHTFLMERSTHDGPRPGNLSRNLVSVQLASTLDGYRREPEEFLWDPGKFTYRKAVQ